MSSTRVSAAELAIPHYQGLASFWAQLARLNRCDRFYSLFEILVKETLHSMCRLHGIAKRVLTVQRALRFRCNCPLAQVHSRSRFVFPRIQRTLQSPRPFGPRDFLERRHYLDIQWHNGTVWQTAESMIAHDKGSL
jgi:hypothetical protein